MIKLILCEGKIDVIFLSYYLEKICDWAPLGTKGSLSAGFNPETDVARGEEKEWFTKENEQLLVFAVGGKDNFKAFIKDKVMPGMVDAQNFSKIILMTDRDNRDEMGICHSFTGMFGGMVPEIKHNCWRRIKYTSSYERPESIDLLLLIIPLSGYGALETVLLDALKEKDGTLVACAHEYIKEAEKIDCGYVSSEGKKLKAHLGAVWAVKSPERAFGLIKTQIYGIHWETYGNITQCFQLLNNL